MFMRLFDQTTHLLQRALDLRSVKHQTILSNVANQDTPHYKAKELDFKKAIRDFLPLPAEEPLSATHPAHFSSMLKLHRTHAAHLPMGGPVLSAENLVVDSTDRTTRVDGNNVNVEQEMARLSENNLLFNASAQMISGKFLKLRNAIREGR